jgi:hypothetical protein
MIDGMKKFHKEKVFTSAKFNPEQAEKVNFNQRKPKMSFEFLSGDFCISKCQQWEKAEVLDTLHRLSQRTWQEIIQLGKSGIGYEQLGTCQLKCSIPQEAVFRNLEKVTVFHKAPRIPIVGFRSEDVFYIFCIDRSYSAYDH